MRLLRWIRTVVEWRLMLEYEFTRANYGVPAVALLYEGGIQVDKVGDCKSPLISDMTRTWRHEPLSQVKSGSWVPCAPISFVGSNPTHLTIKRIRI
jgi:hypothetical protein